MASKATMSMAKLAALIGLYSQCILIYKAKNSLNVFHTYNWPKGLQSAACILYVAYAFYKTCRAMTPYRIVMIPSSYVLNELQ